MKILQLVHQYPPEQVGGTELYTQWLAQALRQRGHQIGVFYQRNAEGRGCELRSEEGVQVWAASAGLVSPARRFLATFRWPAMQSAFRQVLDQFRPDLVHVQHLMGLPTALLNALQQRGIPYIIHLWDFWWVCANGQLLTNYDQSVCDGPRAYLNCARCVLSRVGCPHLWPAVPALLGPLAWRNRLLRQVMKTASWICAPTEFVKNWYAAFGAPIDKLDVVSPGITPPKQLFRRERRPGAPLRFVYIGGFSWQKGIHVLLAAFARIELDSELWIAGDDAANPEHSARLRAMSPDNVRFLGRLDRQQVWETLAQADIMVIPSIGYETFCFALSEAFAVGVPVIASHIGPLAHRVRDGVDGLLTPPGDEQSLHSALMRVLQNPDLLPKLRAGIRPVRTMDEHIEEIESVYREVLSSVE